MLYYIQYVDFPNTFFHFSRSIRTSDYALHTDSTFELANLFFSFNQPNYARWSLSDLADLKLKESPLLNEFKRGAFGVKRSKINFSRSPVDLATEQTVNADAANSLTGISHFTNSISARQRWALSHSMRTRIITHLQEDIKINRKELHTTRIGKDRKAPDSIVNPFDSNLNKNELFNITTGRSVSSKVADFLLNVNEMGRYQKLNFITECETYLVKVNESNKIWNSGNKEELNKILEKNIVTGPRPPVYVKTYNLRKRKKD